MSKRAMRRAALARMKKRARKVYPHDPTARNANHLQCCSCYCCGNPRFHWKQLTMAERRAEEFFVSQLRDMAESE